jgi:hypothetical protein
VRDASGDEVKRESEWIKVSEARKGGKGREWKRDCV